MKKAQLIKTIVKRRKLSKDVPDKIINQQDVTAFIKACVRETDVYQVGVIYKSDTHEYLGHELFAHSDYDVVVPINRILKNAMLQSSTNVTLILTDTAMKTIETEEAIDLLERLKAKMYYLGMTVDGYVVSGDKLQYVNDKPLNLYPLPDVSSLMAQQRRYASIAETAGITSTILLIFNEVLMKNYGTPSFALAIIPFLAATFFYAGKIKGGSSK